MAFNHSGKPLSDKDVDPEDWSKLKRMDVYVRDVQTGVNRLVSLAPDGFSDASSYPVALAPDGSWVMFSTAHAEHYYDAASYDHITYTMIAHLDKPDITFEPVMANGYDMSDINIGGSVSPDGRYVAFNESDQYQSYGQNVALNPEGRTISNNFILDRTTGKVALVTESDDGTPGIIPYYASGETTMKDWGEISISGEGKRAVFSSVQYGIVNPNDFTIQCPDTPHYIYLRECP